MILGEGSGAVSAVESTLLVSSSPLKSEGTRGNDDHDPAVYVIITHEDNAETLRPLVEWKLQKGMSVTLYTTEHIYGNYSGRDDAEKVRNFLKDLENETDIDYLLLAGDIDTVPVREVYCNDSFEGDGDLVPTDSYYAFLEGSWDDNNDDRFGDMHNDSIIWDPDIYVGRFPFSSKNDLEMLVETLIAYEKDPPEGDWFESAMFAAGIVNYNEDQDHNDVIDVNKTDEAKTVEVIRDRFMPDQFHVETLYEVQGLDPANYSCDLGLSHGNVSDTLSSGHSLVILSAHGSTTSMSSEVWETDIDGDNLSDDNEEEFRNMFIDTSIHPSNGDKRPFFYNSACYTGGFQNEFECLAEYLLKYHGIGVVAATLPAFYRPEWDPGDDGGPSNQGLTYRFWEQFLEYGLDPGGALYESKADFTDENDLTACDYKDLFVYNLLGDPALDVWTSIPENLTVDHPVDVDHEEDTIEVSVKDRNEDPMEDAVVTLMNDDHYYKGTTDADGEVVLDIDGRIDSCLVVTVTVPGYRPYQSKIYVETPPVVEDISLPLQEITRSGSVSIYVNGSDERDEEEDLVCSVEYRAPEGSWTAMTDIIYNTDNRVWESRFVANASSLNGTYDIRVMFTDSDTCQSPWMNRPEAFTIQNTAPTATIESVSGTYAIQGEEIVITGNGSDDSGIIEFRWNSSNDGFLGTGKVLCISNLSNGTHTISLYSVDNDHEISDPAELLVTINGRPRALIDGIDSQAGDDCEIFKFYGNGTDDEGIEKYAWTSDIDGNLSSEQAFWTSNLTTGTHTISLRVRDIYGVWSEEVSSIIVVHDRPVAIIESITAVNGSHPGRILDTDTICFVGNTTGEGEITEFRWWSDRNGFLNDSREFTISGLSPGNHTISFQVRSEYGYWSTRVNTTLSIYKRPRGSIISLTQMFFLTNSLTTINYDDSTSRVPGTVQVILRTTSSSVLLEAYGISENAIDEYHWWSDLDGEIYLGTNASVEVPVLSNGTHKISLRVKDNNGVWSANLSTTFTINGIPVTTIDGITPDPAQISSPIAFNGSCSDDGLVILHKWYSSIDGELRNESGSQADFNVTELSPGLHVITLSAKDDAGIWSSETYRLLLVGDVILENKRPVVTIENPANTTEVSGLVELSGSYSDADGQVVMLEVSLQDEGWISITIPPGNGSWTHLWDSTTVKNGIYTIHVRAFDGTDHSEIITLVVTVHNEETVDDPFSEEEGEGGFVPGLGIIPFIGAITIASILVAFENARIRRKRKE